jgi:hypothetical protein
MTSDEVNQIRSRLQILDRERLQLQSRLDHLQQAKIRPPQSQVTKPAITNGSSSAVKVALFLRMFAGRTDVFPGRWENPRTGRSGYAPVCANEWVRGVCGKPQVKCGDCPNKAFIPVTSEVIECHLRGEDRIRANARGGDFVAGVYPLLFDDTCNFLAIDFDGESWSHDALAFVATCRELDVPVALERSRSGTGGQFGCSSITPLQHPRHVASGLFC